MPTSDLSAFGRHFVNALSGRAREEDEVAIMEGLRPAVLGAPEDAVVVLRGLSPVTSVHRKRYMFKEGALRRHEVPDLACLGYAVGLLGEATSMRSWPCSPRSGRGVCCVSGSTSRCDPARSTRRTRPLTCSKTLCGATAMSGCTWPGPAITSASSRSGPGSTHDEPPRSW